MFDKRFRQKIARLPKTRLHRVVQRTDTTVADVVFVHGLGGNAFDTWSDKPDQDGWMHWLAEDIAGLAIWSLDYWAPMVRWSLRQKTDPIADLGPIVLSEFLNEGLGDLPIVFVCHSLGGIIIKQVLMDADVQAVESWRPIAQRVCGVAFLATPHSGAGLATLARTLNLPFRSKVVGNLEKNNEHLRKLKEWYSNNSRELGIRTVAYAETQPLGPTIIVDVGSANPDVAASEFAKIEGVDHSTIAKPMERDHPPYKAILRFVERAIRPALAPSHVFPRRVDGWTFPLNIDDGGLQSLLEYMPPAPGSRNVEVETLVRLATDVSGGTVLVTAPTFGGKTTVMAEVARQVRAHPGVELVALRNERGSQSDRWALDSLISQLAKLLDPEIRLADRVEDLPSQFHRLLGQMVGRRIVVLIDALDEANDRNLLLEALSMAPPPGVTTIVSTRPNPNIPRTHHLASKHTQNMELSEVEEAKARKRAADEWIRSIVDSTEGPTRRVFAALVLSAAPMTPGELTDVLGLEDVASVNNVLHDPSNMSWFSAPGSRGQTRIDHDYLQTGLRRRFGLDRTGAAIDALFESWAERYRCQRWPPETPKWLALGFPLTRHHPTAEMADGSPGRALDLAARVHFVLDGEWLSAHSRASSSRRWINAHMRQLSNEVGDLFVASGDSVDLLLKLLRARSSIHQSTRLSISLISAHARVGNWDRAIGFACDQACLHDDAAALVALSRSIEGDSREAFTDMVREIIDVIHDPRVKAEVLTAIGLAGDPTALDEALTVTNDIRDLPAKAKALAAIGLAGDPTALDEALTVTNDIRDLPAKAKGLAAIVGALAQSNRLDEARNVAKTIHEPETKVQALTAIGLAGDPTALDEALTVTNDIRDLPSKAKGLAAIVGALAQSNRLAEARDIADTIHYPRARGKALASIVGALAQSNRLGEAYEVADTIHYPAAEARALASIVGALAQSNRLDEARNVANTIHEPETKVQALTAIGLAGDVTALDEALTVTNDTRDLPAKARALASIVGALAQSNRLDEARNVANTIHEPETKVQALTAIGLAGDPTALDEALTVTNDIRDLPAKAKALTAIGLAGDPTALDEALTVTNDIRDLPSKAKGLAAIVGALAQSNRLAEARDIADTIHSLPSKAKALTTIVAALAQSNRLAEARDIADTIHYPWARGKALASIVAALAQSSRLDEARTVTNLILDLPSKAKALAAIGLAGDPIALKEAREVADDIQYWWTKAKALAAIGLAGDPIALKEAREAASAAFDNRGRVLTATGVALIQSNRLDEAREIANDITDPTAKVAMLTAVGLAGHAAALNEAQAIVRTIDDRWQRVRMLAELGGDLDGLRQRRALVDSLDLMCTSDAGGLRVRSFLTNVPRPGDPATFAAGPGSPYLAL